MSLHKSLKKSDDYGSESDNSKINFSPEKIKQLNNTRYCGLIDHNKIRNNQKKVGEQSRIAKDGITEITKINKEI